MLGTAARTAPPSINWLRPIAGQHHYGDEERPKHPPDQPRRALRTELRGGNRPDLRQGNRASFHIDCHAHPRMDAALKKMFTPRQTSDVEMAALQDSSLGHRDVRKAAGTFGNRLLAWRIEPRYEPATELRYLGEGVRLAALVGYDKSGSFLDVDSVRFEVPAPVRSSSGCLRK